RGRPRRVHPARNGSPRRAAVRRLPLRPQARAHSQEARQGSQGTRVAGGYGDGGRTPRVLVDGKKSPAALFVPARPWPAPCGPTFGRPNSLMRICRTVAAFSPAKGGARTASTAITSAAEHFMADLGARTFAGCSLPGSDVG